MPLFLVLFALILPVHAIAEVITVDNSCITLAWQSGNNGTEDGFKIHRGLSPGTYDTVTDVGKVYQHTYTAGSCLDPGIVYYFAATAYRGTMESDFSNEIAVIVRLKPPTLNVVSADYGRVGWNNLNGATKHTLRWGTKSDYFGSYKTFTTAQADYRIAQTPTNRITYAVVDVLVGNPSETFRSNRVEFFRKY